MIRDCVYILTAKILNSLLETHWTTQHCTLESLQPEAIHTSHATCVCVTRQKFQPIITSQKSVKTEKANVQMIINRQCETRQSIYTSYTIS